MPPDGKDPVEGLILSWRRDDRVRRREQAPVKAALRGSKPRTRLSEDGRRMNGAMRSGGRAVASPMPQVANRDFIHSRQALLVDGGQFRRDGFSIRMLR